MERMSGCGAGLPAAAGTCSCSEFMQKKISPLIIKGRKDSCKSSSYHLCTRWVMSDQKSWRSVDRGTQLGDGKAPLLCWNFTCWSCTYTMLQIVHQVAGDQEIRRSDSICVYFLIVYSIRVISHTHWRQQEPCWLCSRLSQTRSMRSLGCALICTGI